MTLGDRLQVGSDHCGPSSERRARGIRGWDECRGMRGTIECTGSLGSSGRSWFSGYLGIITVHSVMGTENTLRSCQ
jgi:hypothetical protein